MDRRGEVMASTGMGNVSHILATLHPTIGYDTEGAHHHTAPFARYGNSPGADRAVLDAAIARAHVGGEPATDAEQRERSHVEGGVGEPRCAHPSVVDGPDE
ncbi:amidohydrolase, partial [Streptomyces eurythermus]